MMFFSKLLRSLFGTDNNDLVLQDAMVFNALDQNSIANKLNIENKAKQNGENEKPATNSISADSVELDIETTVMNVVRPVLQNYDNHQSAYNHRSSALSPRSILNKISADADKLKLELKFKLDQAKGEFYSLREELKEVETDWIGFKQKWNITSEPAISYSKTVKIFVLVFLVIIEAIINGFVLAPYSSGGLIEGFGIAIIFPLLTLVGCGFAAGNCLRIFRRPDVIWKRIFFLTMVILFSIPAVMFSLLLAYIRQYIEVDGNWESGYQVWLQVLNGNFVGLGLPGLLLFLFSTVLFIFAMHDIASLDHPIPGLLQKYKRRKELYYQYRIKHKSLQDELLALYKNGTVTSENMSNTLNISQLAYVDLLSKKQVLWNNLQGYIEHIEDVVNGLIYKYREENEKTRKTEAPKYFSDRWHFKLLSYKTQLSLDTSQNANEHFNELHREIREVQSSLQKDFEQIPDVIKSINQDFLIEKI